MDFPSIFGAFFLGVLAASIAEYFRGREISILTNLIAGVGGALLGMFIAGLLDLGMSGLWISVGIAIASAGCFLILVRAFGGRRAR